MKTGKLEQEKHIFFNKSLPRWLFIFLVFSVVFLVEAIFFNIVNTKKIEKLKTEINNPSTPAINGNKIDNSYQPEVSYNLTGVIKKIDGRNISLVVTSKNSKLDFKDVIITPETKILRIELIPQKDSKVKLTKKVALGVEALREGSSVEVVSSTNVLEPENKNVYEIKILD